MPKCSRAKSRSTGVIAAPRFSSAAAAASGPMKRSSARQRGLQLAPIDDEVEHAVFEQELAALEARRAASAGWSVR